jgi:PTS system cellobiose-specific IIB component
MENSVVEGGQDLVLIGPHLADRISAIRSRVTVPVALLPDDVFADRDGERTLALARALLLAGATSPETDLTSPEGTS